MFSKGLEQHRLEFKVVEEPDQVSRARDEILTKLRKEENLRRILEEADQNLSKKDDKEEKTKKIRLEPNFIEPKINIRDLEQDFPFIQKKESMLMSPNRRSSQASLNSQFKPIMLGNSNFEIIQPEVGVTISEGLKVKNGGTNFLVKFGRHSIYDFKSERVNF